MKAVSDGSARDQRRADDKASSVERGLPMVPVGLVPGA